MKHCGLQMPGGAVRLDPNGSNGHELDSELGGSMTGKVMGSRIKNNSLICFLSDLQGEVDKSSLCVLLCLL